MNRKVEKARGGSGGVKIDSNELKGAYLQTNEDVGLSKDRTLISRHAIGQFTIGFAILAGFLAFTILIATSLFSPRIIHVCLFVSR